MQRVATALLLLVAMFPSAAFARRALPIAYGFTRIDGHAVRYVIAKLARVHVQAALGGSEVGDTDWLGNIASRDHALAAINGGFFDAYKAGLRKNLIQSLVVDGSIVFKGDVGSVLFFDRSNHAYIERLPLRIDGSLDGTDTYPNNWYAYWINRMPGPSEATITIFTPAWGKVTGLRGGPQVQVLDGVVNDIRYGSTAIPRDGYVIYFRGEQRVASHFAIGRRVSYTVSDAGEPADAFSNAWEAIGGGPQLLVENSVFTHPRAEGFHDPKVWGSGIRSMVGFSQDQSELILAVAQCPLAECARIMQRLGAYDAMGLDGGASAGLWVKGHYLVTPGREVNNALIIR